MEDAMTYDQRRFIDHLLEKKDVSRLMASRLISELVNLPDRGASGLEQLPTKLDNPST